MNSRAVVPFHLKSFVFWRRFCYLQLLPPYHTHVITSYYNVHSACLYTFNRHQNAFLQLLLKIVFVRVMILFHWTGLGTCLTMAKVWHALNRVYQMENLYWINAVYSTGQSLCQFIFPYTFHTFINAYGSHSAIVLMGSVVLNALPLCLIITQNHKSSSTSGSYLFKNSETASDRYDDMPEYFGNLEIKVENAVQEERRNTDDALTKQLWQNPGKHCDMIDGKMINSFGVEIMDIIEEESQDELDDCSISSILAQRCELITIPKTGRFELMKQWILSRTRHLTDIFYQHIIHHVQRAFKAKKFLPLVLLKSTDIYSYVLCVTVLPHIAITQYNLDSHEIPFLISSLAFPWVIVAVSTPFQGDSYKKNQKQIFVLSGLLKIVGLFCEYIFSLIGHSCHFILNTEMFFSLHFKVILISTSKILLTLSSALIGVTQGTSFFLQDEIIRSSFSQTEWKYLRSSVYFFTGFLLLIFGIVLNLGFTKSVDSLRFSLCLFTISFVCWMLFPHIRNLWISFQKARK